jgi:hypothetical protein
MTYTKGSYSITGTGVQWSMAGAVLRDAITSLKSRQPTTRVMLAVGGATYTNWAKLNVQAVKDFVSRCGRGPGPGGGSKWAEAAAHAWGARICRT